MALLDETVKKPCRGEKLDDTQFDHPLGGDYQEYRECHIKFGWILVYELIDANHLKAWKTGTHDEVFGK